MTELTKSHKLPNMVSFYLPVERNRGALVLGEPDPELYSGPLHWHPVIRAAKGDNFWALNLSWLSVGDKGENMCPDTCVALIDTGTSLIIAPSSIAQAVSSELRISPNCVDTDDGASIIFQFEGSTHRYKLPKPTVTLEMESVESGERVCDSAIKPFRSAEDQNARSSGHRRISRGKGDLGNNM